MKLPYDELKALALARNLSPQSIDRGSFYEISILDGSQKFESYVLKDGGSNQSDFESVLLPKSNKSPVQKVSQTLGDDIYSLRGIAGTFSAPANQTSNHYLLLNLTAPMALKGGILFYDSLWNAHYGDYFSVSVVDKDDVLGTGVPDFMVGEFVKQWYARPGHAQHIDDVSVAIVPYQGLYMRLRYTNIHPLEKVDGFVNLVSYELK